MQIKLAELNYCVFQSRLACYEYADARWSTLPVMQQPGWRFSAHRITKDVEARNLDVRILQQLLWLCPGDFAHAAEHFFLPALLCCAAV